jgi:hypothetical protein
MAIKTNKTFDKGRLFTLFLLGIFIIIFSLQQFAVTWTSKSSLMPLKGTLENCETYVTTVTSKSGHYFHYESKSQKSELIFYLYEFKKKFILSENIGSSHRNEEYEKIKSKLKAADSVTVWVKKSESDFWEPIVFQIDTDRGTALELDTVRFKDRHLKTLLFILGLGCILLPLYLLFPKLFKNKLT